MGRQVVMRLADVASERTLAQGVRLSNLWAGLSSGRLRVVDQQDVSGRRRIVLAPVHDDGAASQALTPIEARIARRVGEARTNKEIAFELGISESAAENHVSRAMRKLGFKDRVALVTLYTQLQCVGQA